MGDRFHHLALLVHLYGVEGLVFCRVVVLLDGVLEHPVDGGDAPLQDVHEPEQDRRLDLPLYEVVHQGTQIDGGLRAGGGMNANIPLLVDGEQVGSPVVHVVNFGGFADRPLFHHISYAMPYSRANGVGSSSGSST